ncbi:hypothetical protein BBJ28_00024649 [Nothophytophthora sp. Chile5]|nr:hypothetical protein BBJ28_00024649 [Nothophytophthora sp. Chile5]
MRGQLGLGTSASVTEPTLVQELAAKRVAYVACSYFHTAIVMDDGELFVCGCNDYGQLGTGDHNGHTVPRPVGFFFRRPPVESLARVRITQVSCGCYHTLALSDDGKVFPFGRNNHGQLGLETSVDCLSPQLISALRDKIVLKVLGSFRRVDGCVLVSGSDLMSFSCVLFAVLCWIEQVAAGFYHSVCLVGSPNGETGSTKGAGTLSGDLRKMLNNAARSDVTFVVEGRPLFAHCCILVARCEPLEKMLDGRMKDGSLPEIVIPEYSVRAAVLEGTRAR